MHEGEVRTDAEQVRRLVAQQFPQWSGLPVKPVPQAGTDHALYRIGQDLVARLPRVEWATGQVETDRQWLPVLAPHLPLPVPVPVVVGEPGEGFPWRWSIVPWLAGDNPSGDNLDLEVAAMDLATFIKAMHGVDAAGGPVKTGGSRGGPLDARDETTRAAIKELGTRVDAAAVTSAWEEALSALPWTQPPVWLHGDVQAGNLLVSERRLCGIIDFAGLGVGDPAVDLMPAWSLLDADSRRIFREALGCEEDTWRRGRGWALSTALIALPYYWETMPAIVAESQRKVVEALRDHS